LVWLAPAQPLLLAHYLVLLVNFLFQVHLPLLGQLVQQIYLLQCPFNVYLALLATHAQEALEL
jgi:hypothetical protein